MTARKGVRRYARPGKPAPDRRSEKVDGARTETPVNTDVYDMANLRRIAESRAARKSHRDKK